MSYFQNINGLWSRKLMWIEIKSIFFICERANAKFLDWIKFLIKSLFFKIGDFLVKLWDFFILFRDFKLVFFDLVNGDTNLVSKLFRFVTAERDIVS